MGRLFTTECTYLPTYLPGGIRYWSHDIYSGQENSTLWEPEEHHDHRGYTNGGWTCGAQLRGLRSGGA